MTLNLEGGHDENPLSLDDLKQFSSMLSTFEPYIRKFYKEHEGPFNYDARELMDGCGYGTWDWTADDFLKENEKFFTRSCRVVYVEAPDGAMFSIRYNYGEQLGFQLWSDEFYRAKKEGTHV